MSVGGPMRSFVAVMALALVGCKTDIALTESAFCDGKKQVEEETVDAPFDRDGDGFFDRSNPGCQANYAVEDLDCNDAVPEVHPGAAELECNGIDDDCDEATVDSVDGDEDGSPACEDCADDDPLRAPTNGETACNGIDDDCDTATIDDADADGDGVSVCDDDCDDDEDRAFPGNDEVCEDTIDNDCNGEIDEICDIDYSGTYTLDQTVAYKCAKYGTVYLIDIAFDAMIAKHTDPNITFRPTTGSQPSLMNGTVSAGSFLVEKTVTGTCNEIYTLQGKFTSENTFEADFSAEFTGMCFDCTYQTWTVTGTK